MTLLALAGPRFSMVKALRFTLHSGIIILAQRFPMVVLTADRKMLSGSGDGLTRKLVTSQANGRPLMPGQAQPEWKFPIDEKLW